MAVLIVLTNHADLGNTGKKTGWYLPEVAHPYHVFKNNSLEVTFTSPKGGETPMDSTSAEMFKDDDICKGFLADAEVQAALKNTTAIKDVDLSKYKVIFFAGGHGPMYDLPGSIDSSNAATKIYEANGIVSGVCHGVVGLLNVKLSDGKYLVDGKKITSFTNSEEVAVNLMEAMPFPLETKLKENGALFENAADWQDHVVVSGRVITGQNPASSTSLAETIVAALKTV